MKKDMFKNAKEKSKEKIEQPHFIFSAQNPRYPTQSKMTHEQTMNHLKSKGYRAEELHSKYGEPEKSIMVRNPHNVQYLHQLAHNLGQESSIYSTGNHHELHFHHGQNAGNFAQGSGTKFHPQKPKDFYSTTKQGIHFTHNLDLNKLYPYSNSVLNKPIKKNEKDRMESLSPSPLTLEHYSSHPGLTQIDPRFKGSGIDSTTKGRDLSHDISFFYTKGAKPESLVARNAKSKYTVQLTPQHRIYNASDDPHNYAQKISKENQGVFNFDKFLGHVKNQGYHGILIDKHPQLPPTVALFHPIDVLHEEPINKLKKSEELSKYLKRFGIKKNK